MKRSVLFLLSVCLIVVNSVNAQQGSLLKKVGRSVANDLLGRPDDSSKSKKSTEPEPACACDQAELIFSLGGKLNLDYTELSISVLDDGSILLKDRTSNKYYIAKGDVTKGPYSEDDPAVAPFENRGNSGETKADLDVLYKGYVSKSGEKYLITFNGKSYGPYARITSFAVPRSKDKFAAIVLENVAVTEADGKKMEEAMNNAKTDQEKMDLAMKYSQQMQQNMMANGGPMKQLPQFVTSMTGTNFDPLMGGRLNGNIKYDDILLLKYDGGVVDMMGNKIMEIKPEHAASENLYINTSNTKYVICNYGNMLFSDGTSMSDLFNPHLIKTDGKVYLAYMYYSPKRNAIMQCKIPF